MRSITAAGPIDIDQGIPKPLVARTASGNAVVMQATTPWASRAPSLPCEMRDRTAAPTAAINSRLGERGDEAGRGRARVPLAVDVDGEGLRDAYLADGATPVPPCSVGHRLARA